MVHLRQMRFSNEQYKTLIRFLTNAGTITLGGLIVGPFIGQQPFRPKLFAVGALLYVAVLGSSLWLAQGIGGDE